MLAPAMSGSILILLGIPGLQPGVEGGTPPAIDADRWVGRWTVDRQKLNADTLAFEGAGSGVSVVEPVLGGGAVLERWTAAGAMPQAGLSLRYSDEDLGRLVSLEYSTGAVPVSTEPVRTEGIVDGAGLVFQPPRVYAADPTIAQYYATRSVFSWPSSEAMTRSIETPGVTGGWEVLASWSYSDREAVAPGPLAVAPVPAECACPSEQARSVDWLIGSWSGTAAGGDGVKLVVSSVLTGCGVVLALEAGPRSSLLILTYDERSLLWHIRELGLVRPLRVLNWQPAGRIRDGVLAVRSASADDLSGLVLARGVDGTLSLELTAADGKERLTVELRRP